MLHGRFGATTNSPYFEARISIPEPNVSGHVSFLPDTGADTTTLMPADGVRLGLPWDDLSKGNPMPATGMDRQTEVFAVPASRRNVRPSCGCSSRCRSSVGRPRAFSRLPAAPKEFSAVRTEGRRRVRRRLKHYNLDAVISVGYRVNTRRGVRQRRRGIDRRRTGLRTTARHDGPAAGPLPGLHTLARSDASSPRPITSIPSPLG